MEWPLRPLPSRNGIGSGSLPGTEESNQAAIRERIETLRQRRAETRLQRRQPSPPRESRGFRSGPSQWLQSRRAVFLFLPILSQSSRRHPTPLLSIWFGMVDLELGLFGNAIAVFQTAERGARNSTHFRIILRLENA